MAIETNVELPGENLIDLTRLQNVLRLTPKSFRTLKSNGITAKVTYKDVEYFDKLALIERLGVKNLDEPFIGVEEVKALLNIKAYQITEKYCKEKTIPFYRLKQTHKGSRLLFLKSEIIEFQKMELEWFGGFHSNLQQIIHLQGIVAEVLGIVKTNHLMKEEWLVILEKRLIEHKPLEVIAEECGVLLSTIVYKFYKARDRLEILIKRRGSATKENQLLREHNTRLQEEIGRIRLKYLMLSDTINKNIVHDTPIEDIDIPVTELNFSARILHAFRGAGIMTLNDLLKWKVVELMKLQNLGKGSVREILELLEEKELFLDVKRGDF